MKAIKSIIISLSIFCLCVFISSSVHANSIQSHSTSIETVDDTYTIEEKITVMQTSSNISFYVQNDINDLSVVINNTDIDFQTVSENIYLLNYTSGLDLEKTMVIISYSYPKKETMQFSKQILYDTALFTVSLDNQNIASYENIKEETSLMLTIPEKQDTSKSLNLFSTILIGLLVILLIVTTMYGIKKRGNGKQRNRDVESTELLATEKSLLMSVLKDIEKKHRDKKISDETYEKLKSHYKQQTVEIMSSLED